MNFPSIATYGVFSFVCLTLRERASLYCTKGFLINIGREMPKVRRISNMPNMPTIPNMTRLVIW